MAIDIMIERLQNKMSGTTIWNFVYVLKRILFDRREQTDEILQGINRGKLISARAAAITAAGNSGASRNSSGASRDSSGASGDSSWASGDSSWASGDSSWASGDISWASGNSRGLRGDGMITIKTRDKFVVVNEALRRV